MKKTAKKLALAKETVAALLPQKVEGGAALGQVVGGGNIGGYNSWSYGTYC